MKRTLVFTIAVLALLVVGFTISSDAQETQSNNKDSRQAQHEARQQQRAQRLAEYREHLDSAVISRNYSFVPETMQQLPAGMMRNLQNPCYEVVVWSEAVDVCIPFLKGYTPPYYTVIYNYVLPSVMGYTAEQTDYGWHVTFQSTMFSSTTFTFTFEIYTHYGGATLTISSPFYNSVQYTGNIIGI